MQLTFDQQTLERHLVSRDEVLHEVLQGVTILRIACGLQDGTESFNGSNESRRIVGADHSATRAQAKRLDDARIARPLSDGLEILADRLQAESRHGNTRTPEQCPLQKLVTRGLGRLDRVAGSPERSVDLGRQHNGIVLDAESYVDGISSGELENLFAGASGVIEIEGEQGIRTRLLERAGLL